MYIRESREKRTFVPECPFMEMINLGKHGNYSKKKKKGYNVPRRRPKIAVGVTCSTLGWSIVVYINKCQSN